MAISLFKDFSKVLDSIHREKMEQILLEYGLPTETVTTIIMLYRNRKAMVCSFDGDKRLQYCHWSFGRRYTSTIYVYNCLDYSCATNVSRSYKRKSFHFKNDKSRLYPAETMTDADYADDLTLHASTPTPAESLWHSLEQTARGIGLYEKAQKRANFTLRGKPVNFVDHFTYVGSNTSSTESDQHKYKEGIDCSWLVMDHMKARLLWEFL